LKNGSAFLLILVFLLVLPIGCASDNGFSWPTKTQTAETKAEAGSASDLVIVYLEMGNSPTDINMVVNEINKISKSKINSTIKMIGINTSNYEQQTRLMLASREKVDLMLTGNMAFMDFSGQVMNEQLLALNQLIEKNGPDIKYSVGEFLGASTIKGKIFGIPTLRDEAKAAGYAIRKDLVEKYKIDTSKIKSLEDIEPVLKTIKKVEPGLAPFFPGQADINGIDTAMRLPGGDILGSDYFFSGVLMNAQDKNLKVVNYYETPEYAAMVKLMRKWNLAGYILPEVITNNDSSYTLVKNGKLASFLQDIKPGIDGQVSRQCAREMVVIPIAPPISTTNVVTSFMWSIPSYCKNPGKAMDFLNLMYSDSNIINLLDWGIEGKHYEKQADGTIYYPTGVNASNTGYGMSSGFIFGNQLLSYVWKGDPVDLWKQMETFNKTAIKSKAFGYEFDSTAVKTEYAACIDIWQQYQKALGVGAVNPDKILPEFIAKLKAAGADKVLAEKQRQLNVWAKENGVK